MQTYLDILKELSEIPNAPFSPIPRLDYLKRFISRRGLDWEENDFSLIVRAGSAKSKNKLVLMSHVDHPGLVFKNNSEYLSFGTLYTDKISKKYKGKYPLMDIYTKSGDLVEEAKITKITTKSVKFDFKANLPTNSQGLWHVDKFKTTKDKIYCRSHDNDLPTAIMLDLLDKYADSKYQILFVFTIYEEVFQYSSYALARNNILEITSNDIVINLESMKAYNIAPDHKEYGKVNYTAGPILHISEKGTLYGAHEDIDNKAEDLILNTAKRIQAKIQQGLAGGSNDARPFSEFKRTPHVVTINMPNQFKHNVKPDGTVTSEEVIKHDADTVKEILRHVLDRADSFSKITSPTNSLSLKAKNSQISWDKNLMTYKNTLNERLYWAYKPKAKRRYYYAETLIDAVADFLYKGISYIVYFFLKLTGR